ncbi:MAG: ATP synthase subunit C [Candidatus Atabeyarchaeum deiterrae]
MKNKGKNTKPFITRRTLILLSASVLLTTISATFVLVNAQTPGDTMYKGLIGVGVGLAMGLAGLGAGLGMGSAGAAAVGAISERPEVFGKAMIFIVFIEAIGIYGLLIAFLLIGQMA